MSQEKPVFSTKKDLSTSPVQDESKPLAVGPIKIRLETKGRGGKSVTVLFNLPMTELKAKALGKDLQARLGVGGTFKDGAIELRGDLRSKVELILSELKIPAKRAGG